MLDLKKDIQVEVYLNVAGKRLALANIIIGGLIKVMNFEIVRSEKGKIYVVNPHIISNVYNKTSCKREITYLSTASLLEHENRKELIEIILDSYAKEIEKIRKDAKNIGGVKNVKTGMVIEENRKLGENRDYSI